MLQRIQTIYWLLANLCLYGYIFLYNGFKFDFSNIPSTASSIVALLTTFLILIIIISYRKRKLQINLSYLAMLLIIVQYGVRFYFTNDLKENWFHFSILVFACIFIFSAIRRTKKDLDLVSDSGRLR